MANGTGPIRITEGPPPTADHPATMPPLSTDPLERRFVAAFLLFVEGMRRPWTPEDHAQWRALTGQYLCTTSVLAGMARTILAAQETDGG